MVLLEKLWKEKGLNKKYFKMLTKMEIPTAASPKTENVDCNDYESQQRICLEAIEKINEKCSTVSVVFHGNPSEQLVSELKEKGYNINYTLDYDSKKEKPFSCRLKINNPNFKDNCSEFMSNMEENMKKIGFSQASVDTEEKLKNLFNNFVSFQM